MENLKPVRVVLESPKGILRTIANIVRYSDGGFGLMLPYHSAKQGYLEKVRPERLPNSSWFKEPEKHDCYRVSSRVKLSCHPDGFAHFSGVESSIIRSGRDKETGAIKGLGVLANPFEKYSEIAWPIFGLVLAGLDDFKISNPNKLAVYFRGSELSSDAGGTGLMDEPVRTSPPRFGYVMYGLLIRSPKLYETVPGSNPVTRSYMARMHPDTRIGYREMRMVRLNIADMVLGIDLRRCTVRLPSANAYSLSGPTGRDGFSLQALYPRPDVVHTDNSLDRIVE